MIISLALAAALGVFAILFDGVGSRTFEILATALLVGGFSTIALICAIVQGKGRFAGLMWTGIGTGGGALLTWLLLIWFDPWAWFNNYEVEEHLATVGGTFTTLSLWSAHYGLLSLPRLDREPHRVIRACTLGLAGALGLAMILVLWTQAYEEWSAKMIGVLTVLASCGTVVTPVLALIEHLARRGEPETLARRVEIDLSCPRCGTAQRVRAGGARCKSCGLRVNVDVEEPRCWCGYLLYKLESDRCPECGRAVPDDQRWQRPAQDVQG